MVKASGAKADRVKKSTGVKAVSKKKAAVKKAVPGPKEDGSIKQLAGVVEKTMQENAEANRRQSEQINSLVSAVERQMSAMTPSNGPQPVRLKLHRDKNDLLEYIDIIPVEVTTVKH